MAEFVNSEGIPFFDQEYKKEKWEAAAAACLDAINTAHEAGASLYKFDEKLNYTPSSTLQQELTLRNTITGRFNSEIIWALGSNATDGIQNLCQAHLTSYSLGNRMIRSCSQLVPSLEIVEQFYTANGVPMDEDKDYEYENRYKLTTTPEDDPIHFTPNYTTIKMHLTESLVFMPILVLMVENGSPSNAVTTMKRAPILSNQRKEILPAFQTNYIHRQVISQRNWLVIKT